VPVTGEAMQGDTEHAGASAAIWSRWAGPLEEQWTAGSSCLLLWSVPEAAIYLGRSRLPVPLLHFYRTLHTPCRLRVPFTLQGSVPLLPFFSARRRLFMAVTAVALPVCVKPSLPRILTHCCAAADSAMRSAGRWLFPKFCAVHYNGGGRWTVTCRAAVVTAAPPVRGPSVSTSTAISALAYKHAHLACAISSPAPPSANLRANAVGTCAALNWNHSRGITLHALPFSNGTIMQGLRWGAVLNLLCLFSGVFRNAFILKHFFCLPHAVPGTPAARSQPDTFFALEWVSVALRHIRHHRAALFLFFCVSFCREGDSGGNVVLTCQPAHWIFCIRTLLSSLLLPFTVGCALPTVTATACRLPSLHQPSYGGWVLLLLGLVYHHDVHTCSPYVARLCFFLFFAVLPSRCLLICYSALLYSRCRVYALYPGDDYRDCRPRVPACRGFLRAFFDEMCML